MRPLDDSPRNFAVPNGLVGYWGCDPDCWDASSGLAIDLVKNNNVPKFSGIPMLTNGQVRGALDLSGTNKYLKLGTTAGNPLPKLPQGANPLSLLVWMKLKATSTSSTLFGSGPLNAAYQRISFYTDGTGMGVELAGVGTMTNWTQDLLWHHWCFTYPGGNVKTNGLLYKDGIVQAPNHLDTANGTLANDFSILFIGNGQANIALNGILDECRIYDRALTAHEVFTLYQTGLAGKRDALNYYSLFSSSVLSAPSFIPAWASQSNPPIIGAGIY